MSTQFTTAALFSRAVSANSQDLFAKQQQNTHKFVVFVGENANNATHYLCLSAVLVLQPPQSGTNSYWAFVTLPLPILFAVFLKLTASSHCAMCTLNTHLPTYLLA